MQQKFKITFLNSFDGIDIYSSCHYTAKANAFAIDLYEYHNDLTTHFGRLISMQQISEYYLIKSMCNI